MSNLILSEVISENSWNDLFVKFKDANIYQLWNYARIVNKEKQVIHYKISKNEEVIAILIVRIKTIPVLKKGIAYIFRGPLWIRNDEKPDLSTLNEILIILHHELVIKKKLLLRIRPFIFKNSSDSQLPVLFDNFYINNKINIYKSLDLDLNRSLNQIKSGFRRTWRQELHKSQSNGLEVISGTSNHLFKDFLIVYSQMHDRKKFSEHINVMRLESFNEILDPRFKIQIFITYKGKRPVGCLLGSGLGDIGIAISGGVNEKGMELKASYLLQWELIKWLKYKGCKKYDLGGINQLLNPGGYIWKTGISKNEIQEIGIFESYNNRTSKLITNVAESILHR